MRRLLYILLLALVAYFGFKTLFNISSCFGPMTVGKGEIIEDRRSLDDFSSVSSSILADLEIEKSTDYAVEIKGYQNLMRKIKTNVRNGRLYIDINGRYKTRKRLKITVYTPELEKISLSGAGKAEVSDFFRGDKLNIHLSGVASIKAPDIKYDRVNCNVSGSGSVTLGGEAELLEADISGVGSVHAYELSVEDCKASVSGAGNVYCNPEESLKASVSGVGSVHYKGNPDVNKSVSGAGKVKRSSED